MRTLIFASLLLLPNFISAQYTLTVESSVPVVAPGTTYRFYVNMVNPTDRMSAVFGNNNDPLEINAPDGVFNSEFNSSWSASGINPTFLAFFPDMADDTYATIGLDGPAVGAQEDPSIVEDPNQPSTPFFITDGSTQMLSNTLVGSAYYILNTAENGLPDANMRILILQVTTTGAISGTFNYGVFPLGVGADQVQTTIHFDGVGTFMSESGCTNSTACNYNSAASQDDGSCILPDTCGVCDGDNSTCTGCTISIACNYDPTSIIDDGSCVFFCPGCTDPSACNYDMGAIQDNGTCITPLDIYGFDYLDCNGDCVNDPDGDGVCTENEILGCVDSNACNYSIEATEDDFSCLFAVGCDFCENGLVINGDIDSDGVCNIDEVLGCTVFEACNYDALATENDESCLYNYDIFPSGFFDCSGNCVNDIDGDGVCDELEILGCMIIGACNYNFEATEENGSCEFTTCAGCTYAFACNYDPLASIFDYSCVFDVCAGCTDMSACNYNPTISEDDGSCLYLDALGVCGGTCAINLNGDLVCDCFEDLDGDGICDDVDDCVGIFDECGVCNGLGAIYECGCDEIPLGDCDCAGNTLDACGQCVTTVPEGYWLGAEQFTVHTGGALDGLTTWRLYLNCVNETDYLSSVSGDDLHLFSLETTTSWYQDPFGVTFGSEANPAFYGFFPDLEFDSWLTIGAESSLDGITISSVTGVTDPFADFAAGNNMYINDATGSAWFSPFPGTGDLTMASFAGPDLKILVAQLTTAGDISGEMQLQVFMNADQSQEWRDILPILYSGCTDPIACNYNEFAEYCDNSCQYMIEGACDCEGNVLADDCGVCDGPGAIYECGCSDIPVGFCDCNGNILDECGVCGGDGVPIGDCDCDGNQLDAIGVCGGTCIEDNNSNGICDSEECIPADFCGEGLIFDETTQLCVIAFQGDINYDGCVDLNDLMDLLSAYGLCDQ